MTGGRTDGHQAFKEARQKGSFGCGRTPSNLWLRPALEFHEARSLCQSRHAAEAAVITIAVAKAPNNATIIAMIATKVSVIDIRFRSSIFAVGLNGFAVGASLATRRLGQAIFLGAGAVAPACSNERRPR